MIFYPTTRRKSVRREFHAPVEYEIKGAPTDTVFKGHTLNISDSGLCLCLYHRVDKRQEITIKSSRLPFACKKAVVRWVRRVDRSTYMAGVACIDCTH
jgi:PilZ domain